MREQDARMLHRVLLGLGLLLCSCALGGRAAGPPPAPPLLRVEFDSGTAAARLRWGLAAGRDFLGYEVQRTAGEGGEYAVLARLSAAQDTAWSDEGLQADLPYQYRIAARFGRKGKVRHSLTSAAVEGGIHRHAASWPLPEGFLPTRLAVDAQGDIAVAGAGAGRVERFDPSGRPLGSWTFAEGPLACLETGVLDAVPLAFDSQGALYVAYNLLEEGRAPSAWWAKFDAQGRQLWTRTLSGLFARHLAVGPGDLIYIESIDRLHQFDTGGELVAEYAVPPLLISGLRFWGGRFALLVEPVNYLEMGWQAPRLMVYEGPERREAQWSVGREPLSAQEHGRGVLKRPSDFAVDEALDRVFIVNAGQSRIEVFRRDQYLTSWGREGGGAGAFRFAGEAEVIEDMASGRTARRRVVAGGIARDQEGYIYVADTFNNRVQKFQP
ncbi:MAG: hypothetical protein HYW07_11090 [Candidatus Latescibacteria bacterium]|nr:hypothetical protein [Candidatus Latescibacterota bacterium]